MKEILSVDHVEEDTTLQSDNCFARHLNRGTIDRNHQITANKVIGCPLSMIRKR